MKFFIPVQSWSDDIALEEGQDEDENQRVAMELENAIPFHKLQKCVKSKIWDNKLGY